MSFRQDRTNPSSAVSNWKGRTETPKAWPSTSVSTWLNKGLFGPGATVYRFMGWGTDSGGTNMQTLSAGVDNEGNHYFIGDANSGIFVASFDSEGAPRGSIRYLSNGASYHWGSGFVDRENESCWCVGRGNAGSSNAWQIVRIPFSDFSGSTAWTINNNSASTPNAWQGGGNAHMRYPYGIRAKTIGSTLAVVTGGNWLPYSNFQPGMMLNDWTEIANASENYSWQKSVRSDNSNTQSQETGIITIDSYNQVWLGYGGGNGAIQQRTSALSSAKDTSGFATTGNDNRQLSTNSSGNPKVVQTIEDTVNTSSEGGNAGSDSTYYHVSRMQMTGAMTLMVTKTTKNGYTVPHGMTNNIQDMRTGGYSVDDFNRVGNCAVVADLGHLYLMAGVNLNGGYGTYECPFHIISFDGTDMSIRWHNVFWLTRTSNPDATGVWKSNRGWSIDISPDYKKLICYFNWSPTAGSGTDWKGAFIELPVDGTGTWSHSSTSGKAISTGPNWTPNIDFGGSIYRHYYVQTAAASNAEFSTISHTNSPAFGGFGANINQTTDGGSYNQDNTWGTTTVATSGTGIAAQEIEFG